MRSVFTCLFWSGLLGLLASCSHPKTSLQCPLPESSVVGNMVGETQTQITIVGKRLGAGRENDIATGIAFQYFTTKQMCDLSVRQGIYQAAKADIATISAWQVGMYGMMAVLQLLVFRCLFGGMAAVNTFEFWFAMQIAMIAGFCTSYPVNWLLIRAGVKEEV